MTTQQGFAEKWVFVPSKENACHIRVLYDQDAVKNNRLIEKYDYSAASDCDPAIRQRKMMVIEHQLNCQSQSLIEISRTVHFKDGKVSRQLSQQKANHLPKGTQALLLNAACKPKLTTKK